MNSCIANMNVYSAPDNLSPGELADWLEAFPADAVFGWETRQRVYTAAGFRLAVLTRNHNQRSLVGIGAVKTPAQYAEQIRLEAVAAVRNKLRG